MVWLVVLSMLLTGCSSDKAPPPTDEPAAVKTWRVREVASPMEASLVGTVDAPQQVKLAFEIEGRLTELNVVSGSTVSKGTVLARLDSRALQLKVERAKAERRLAELEYERLSSMHAKSMISQADRDEAQIRYQLADIEVRERERELNDATLLAPWNATVIERLADPHHYIEAGQPVITIAPSGVREVVTFIPEKQIAARDFSHWQQAEVAFSHDPKQRWPLTLREYTSKASAVSRAFELRYDLTVLPPWPLLPGMSAQVYFPAPRAAVNFVEVPSDALLSGIDDRFWVWRIRANRVEQVWVKSHGIKGNLVAVTGELAPGDVLVASGGRGLQTGEQVVALPARKQP